MKKSVLKKSIKIVLENSKQAIIKTIAQAMRENPPTQNEVCWLLLEFTSEFPFPPTLGLAKSGEFDNEVYTNDHPLLCYNAADLELFSERDTIVIDFSEHDELFETAYNLLEEIEYEDRELIILELYVAICKALTEDSDAWKKMKLSKDFHVTARDYVKCDEEYFLETLLPESVYSKIKNRINDYEKQVNDKYEQDELIIKVKSIIEKEAEKYELLYTKLNNTACTNVYAHDEVYFIRPNYVEITFHKLPEEREVELSTMAPKGLMSYYHYKFHNNIPIVVDYYFEEKLIWRKMFQHKEGMTTSHKFFLKSGTPEIEEYIELIHTDGVPVSYSKFMYGSYNEIKYSINGNGKIVHELYYDCLFDIGYKLEAQLDFLYEYKNNTLFKILQHHQNGHSTVTYCCDNSFMEEEIDAFVDHICNFTIAKMKEVLLESVSTVVLEYEPNLPFYFRVGLLKEEEMIDLSTYELYEDNSAMNLALYTSHRAGVRQTEYFSADKAQRYIQTTYQALCLNLTNRINNEFHLAIKAICKSTNDEME